MVSDLELMGEELEREITITYQSLILKNSQLDETKRKLRKELLEHQIAKIELEKTKSEIDNFKIKFEVNLEASVKLKEENAKAKEMIAKLQTQMDAYEAERQMLLERCHNAEMEICNLKNQIGDLHENIDENFAYRESCAQYQTNTKKLIDQILSKQEDLNLEQSRLEKVCKEGLSLTSQLSNEIAIQSIFVKEANITRIKLENETVRLIGALIKERNEKNKLLKPESSDDNKRNYLNDWKSSQDNMTARLKHLTEENKNLLAEVKLLKDQIDLLMEENVKTFK